MSSTSYDELAANDIALVNTVKGDDRYEPQFLYPKDKPANA